jgi:hypothetical protein
VSNSFRRTIQIPAGSTVSLADESFGGPTVLILPPGASSIIDVLRGTPKLNAAVTHDRGLDWPDAAGCQLAQAAINGGGAVTLVFTRWRDAKRCEKRLLEGRHA